MKQAFARHCLVIRFFRLPETNGLFVDTILLLLTDTDGLPEKVCPTRQISASVRLPEISVRYNLTRAPALAASPIRLPETHVRLRNSRQMS